MFLTKSFLPAVLHISCVVVLTGCMTGGMGEQNNSNQDINQLAFDPPPSLRQNRAIDASELYVEITVNNTLVQTVRNGGNQQWLATVLLPVNATSTISVAWFQPWQCIELLLATATQTVNTGSEAIGVNFPDGYDLNHDSNGNGTNNLDELVNGTSPADCTSDAPNTPGTTTTSDTADTPTATDTTDTPTAPDITDTQINPTTPDITTNPTTPNTPITPETPINPSTPIFPEMVAIPAGCFNMGSPADEANRDASREMQRNVCVNDFSIGVYEVTLAEFDRYTSANDLPTIRDFDEFRDGYPIRDVTWIAANAYASWLSSQDGNTYRLPTEQEWEYATRAGTTTAFNTGNSITTDQARFAANDGPLKVGSFAPNDFGLYDTHGNILEMTCSEFSADYSSANTCITDVAGVEEVVARGGAHNYARSIQLRSAARRDFITPDGFKNSTGFRLVKE